MEAPEVPTEHLHEEMHHRAGHSGERWTLGVALSSALLAGFAAVSSLLAGHHANEAMIEQIRASDEWNFYQAKSIKENLLSTKAELLDGLGKEVSAKDKAKQEEYRREKEEISAKARRREGEAHHYLETHVIFARGVTLFQVAIAIGAISVLTQRRRFWYVSIAFGLAGLFFLIQGGVSAMKIPEPGGSATEAKSH